MNTSSNHFFDTPIFGQPASLPAPASTRTNTATKRKVNPASTMSTSLWRYTQAECEATQRHGFVTRGLCGLLGVLSLGSVAVAGWQMHALLSGSHLHDAISAFLH